MKTLDQWFSIYAVSHQNPTNKKIHYWCVPLIFYSTLGFLEGISRAEYLNLPISLSLMLVLSAGVFYLRLKSSLAVCGLVIALLCWVSFYWFTSDLLVFGGAVIFVVAWIGQFVGHKIEGAKPSFLQDIVFLLIGPLWVLKAVKEKL